MHICMYIRLYKCEQNVCRICTHIQVHATAEFQGPKVCSTATLPPLDHSTSVWTVESVRTVLKIVVGEKGVPNCSTLWWDTHGLPGILRTSKAQVILRRVCSNIVSPPSLRMHSLCNVSGNVEESGRMDWSVLLMLGYIHFGPSDQIRVQLCFASSSAILLLFSIHPST